MNHLKLCALLTLLSSALTAPLTAAPEAYEATYSGRFSGAKVEIESTLLPANDGGWVFRRWSEPRGMARLIRREGVLECVRIGPLGDELRPLDYHYIDGKPGEGKSATIKYDHEAGIATSTYQNTQVSLPLENSATDRLFEEIVVAGLLLTLPDSFSVTIMERNELHTARYKRIGETELKTKAGRFDTVIYERRRGESSRTTRFWYAPAENFIPVRIERLRKGKSQGRAELTHWKKLDAQALGSVTPVCP